MESQEASATRRDQPSDERITLETEPPREPVQDTDTEEDWPCEEK